MIKSMVFDIGNVILNFDVERVLREYTSLEEEREFILKNVINSPEWLGYGLIDTGYLSRESAIEIVCDRTNHLNDRLINDFWNNYDNYAFVDKRVLEMIKKLKNEYKIYLLSNINQNTYNSVKKSGLFDLVDGYVLSFQEHMIKPYEGVFKRLIEKYNLVPEETLFIDDNLKNIETGKKLGFISKKVKPDNYEDLLEAIKEELNFSKNCIFETDNIILTKVSRELVDEYLALVNDKDIQRMTLTKEKKYDKEKELTWIDNVLENNELVFSMLEKGTYKFIGNASLEIINKENAEIAISIKSTMQGYGYGKEAINGLINYSKEVLNFKELIAVIFSNNKKSLHCFERFGFQEYRRKEGVKIENGKSIADVYLKLEL